MTRKAFIIVGFAPYKESWLDNPSNVHIDIDSKHMKKYLESDVGGSWLHNVDLKILIDQPQIRSNEISIGSLGRLYFYFFTGHGSLIE